MGALASARCPVSLGIDHLVLSSCRPGPDYTLVRPVGVSGSIVRAPDSAAEVFLTPTHPGPPRLRITGIEACEHGRRVRSIWAGYGALRRACGRRRARGRGIRRRSVAAP